MIGTQQRVSETDLRQRIEKLERINAALITHVERATDQHGGAYSLFQTAIMLDGRVKARTEELTGLMLSLERSNGDLKAAKEEAERANRSKTKFLVAASHDLLQPLNAARLSTSALLDLPLDVAATAIAGQVERGLQTIEDLIKTLLDISKLDAGVVKPIKKTVRLKTICADIEEGCWRLAEKKTLRLVVRCADVSAHTDPILLQRILQNLVSNALRYTSEGGVVLAVRVRDDRCAIDVIDSGPGIPEAERKLVFEEFYRGKSSVGEAGLGLGLSIVRRMVDALGDRLEVHSRVGHGSRFRLTLPLATGPATERAAASCQVTPPTVGARVVVIENDDATAAAVVRLLTSWHYEAVACRTTAAWRRDIADAPHAVLADYHLDDDATGLEAIAAIRNAVGYAVPAIVMTADHSEEVGDLVRQAGCEILRKPLKAAELRSLLSLLLGQATEHRD